MLFQQTTNWLLASNSEIRAKYLRQFSFKFDVYSPDIDESVIKDELVCDYVMRMALSKAGKAKIAKPNYNIIIASDTAFSISNMIFDKPITKLEAFKILCELNGQTHDVHTAVYIAIKNQAALEFTSYQQVKFFEYPIQVIQAYVDTEEGLNKAGACSIEGIGSFLVSDITGSWTAITGFPIEQFINQMWRRGLLTCLN